MPRLDETRPFIPVRIAVLTVSDTRSIKDDKSGDTLAGLIGGDGHELADRAIEKDDIPAIRARVEKWIADPSIDVVITTGGTGFTGRDVTPEAVKPVPEAWWIAAAAPKSLKPWRWMVRWRWSL